MILKWNLVERATWWVSLRPMRIGNDWVMYDDDEAGAGGLGSSAPDTASDDEALGLIVVEAVLPMPPVVTGASFLGSSAPDTASNIEL